MNITSEELLKEARALEPQLQQWRRTLHRHPEVGFDLPHTKELVKKALTEMGYKPKDCGKAGVIALAGGKKPGKTILLRADMDALPIPEDSGEEFSSEVPGKMHGCGHDMHTAMLLGAAKLLKAHEDELEGTVKLEFQPAEEIFQGSPDMIAGDLFHRQPMNKDLQELNYLFGTIPSTHVVIISGEHDRIEANSALLSFNWSPNVHWILEDTPQSLYFDDINTEVYGFSYHTRELRETVIDGIQPAEDGHIHILLAHGGDRDHMPVETETLAALPFDYVALGHIHKPTELVERRVIYAGTPEPLEQSETGAHGIYVGDIHPITHRIQKLEFVPLAAASYVPLQISVTERTSNEELQRLISAEIEKRGTQNIYRLRITGKHDPEVSFDLAPLRERYRIVTVEDMSEPQYDFVALYREHPSDMIGFYIRKLLRENPDDMSDIEKKALYYGIHALLQSQKGGL